MGAQTLIVEEAIDSSNDDVIDEMVHKNESLILAKKYKLKMGTHAANQLGLQASCAFVAYVLATSVGASLPLLMSMAFVAALTIGVGTLAIDHTSRLAITDKTLIIQMRLNHIRFERERMSDLKIVKLTPWQWLNKSVFYLNAMPWGTIECLSFKYPGFRSKKKTIYLHAPSAHDILRQLKS